MALPLFLAGAAISLGVQGIKYWQDWKSREERKKTADTLFKPIEYNAGQERQNLRTGTASRVNQGVQAAGRQASAMGTSGTGQTLATGRSIANVGAQQIQMGNEAIEKHQFAVDQANRQMDIQRQNYIEGSGNPADYIPGAVEGLTNAYMLGYPEKFVPGLGGQTSGAPVMGTPAGVRDEVYWDKQTRTWKVRQPYESLRFEVR